MYPNLTPALTVLLAAALAGTVFIALRRPFLRRLAMRHVQRRPLEAALVVAGSILGTTIIVTSLIVGDTLNFSVKSVAYTGLGPVDEVVTSADPAAGADAAGRLERLRTDPDVDGVLTAHTDRAAVVRGSGHDRVAEPQATVWDMDFAAAARFTGGVAEGSGLSGPAPGPGEVVVNAHLAEGIGVAAGDRLTVYLYGKPREVTVARVVPARGVAGAGTTAAPRNVYFAPGTLVAAAEAAGGQARPQTVTFVSNTGDVEGGDRLSPAVERKILDALGPLARAGTSVETTKHDVLDAAKVAGDSLGALFLFIGSFSIIAGILLLVNIFVMLAEERKSQLGMLRAIGMTRGRVVRGFVLEGTVYALAASLLGGLVGIGVGRAVVEVAARIFTGLSPEEGGLTLSFHVTWISLLNGAGTGFLIAFATVLATSVRISRINIIAAIRDLPRLADRHMSRRTLILSTVLAAISAAGAVSALMTNNGLGTYLYPSLTVLFLVPLLLRLAPKRRVYTGASAAVLAWGMTANLVRPDVFRDGRTATYIALGTLVTFAAVILVSENQQVLLRPLRPLINRQTSAGLATRLGVAYPLARRFRTGAILIMYGIVVFTLVLITTLSSMIDSTLDTEVAHASAGYAIRADFNPAAPVPDPVTTLRQGRFAGRVAEVQPLLSATAEAVHVGIGVRKPLDVVAVGVPAAVTSRGTFTLSGRMPAFADDAAAWLALETDSRYVILDRYIGMEAGAGAQIVKPGDTMTLINPHTGQREEKIVAGMLQSAYAFYGAGAGVFLNPVIMSAGSAYQMFGDEARLASVLIRPTAGTPDGPLASDLQGEYLASGLVATRIRTSVEHQYAASRGFFQLMQGFLALGLLVGVAGLGVTMVRSVGERRRTIGVLRALGFPARTVRAAFLTESSFIAVEGILIGAGLSIVTSYLLFTNHPDFAGLDVGFPVPWLAIGVMVVLTFAASLAATFGPARRAAQIKPAVALRVSD